MAKAERYEDQSQTQGNTQNEDLFVTGNYAKLNNSPYLQSLSSCGDKPTTERTTQRYGAVRCPMVVLGAIETAGDNRAMDGWLDGWTGHECRSTSPFGTPHKALHYGLKRSLQEQRI